MVLREKSEREKSEREEGMGGGEREAEKEKGEGRAFFLFVAFLGGRAAMIALAPMDFGRIIHSR